MLLYVAYAYEKILTNRIEKKEKELKKTDSVD